MNNLLFLNLGTLEIIIIIFMVILPFILALICLIDILKSNFRDSTTTKLIWVLIVLVAPVIGSLIYIFFGKQKKITNFERRAT
ncbi:PLD nuclease N-terminal domain-containing protein [Pedobacter sp. P351]|uniref:PLD nuclease N-terminal domain-containing protein n=1 Tax=Pedobacter superstes TaxID=3133441 RepID=UPI00309EDD7D